MNNLQDLGRESARAGTVIAFKELTMTPNFQPGYSNYRTARIENIIEEDDQQVSANIGKA